MRKQILFIPLIFFFILLVFSSCQKRPEAGFQTENTLVNTDEQISFINTTTDGYYYQWDFGDGTTSKEMNPVHSYNVDGKYTIELIAFSKNRKKTDKVSAELTVLRSQEIKINNESFPLGKGYLVKCEDYYNQKYYFDVVLVNTNLHYTLDYLYFKERNDPGHLLFLTLRSSDENVLKEGIYTYSPYSDPNTFLGSFMLIDIDYYTGEYIYYESFEGIVEVNIIGETYEFEINLSTTIGENVNAYFIGHLTLYEKNIASNKNIISNYTHFTKIFEYCVPMPRFH